MDKLTDILEEVLDANKITRLSVFDFDNTLVDTPTPDIGKSEWKEKTGTDWPYKGWWGRKESLDMNVFEMPVIPKVISNYKNEISRSDTLVVMLTGRIPKLSNEVEAILGSKGLKFDRYMYNYGGETSDNKLEQMDKILKEFPKIKEVNMWEDRIPHAKKFQGWGESLEDIKFNVNIV